MVSGESPAVARRRVRLALRRARGARSLTQSQVAKALEWSLSKVNRIESGEVSISTTDLKALLEYYGIDDAGTVRSLVEDARTSRRERWYTDPRYREHLSVPTKQLLQFEGEATAIRAFHLTMIPGVLQTAEYARVCLEHFTDDLTEADIAVRFEVRMKRRDEVFSRPEPPDYYLILDESVLHREVGDARVMAEQLVALRAQMANPSVWVRIVPFAAAAPIAMLGPFTILDFGDEENAVLYRETHLLDQVVEVAAQVERHRRIFEQLWALSYDEEASARLIDARAAAMLSSLDRKASPG
jgi:transcriptional regulator with XRE-family HTH domain